MKYNDAGYRPCKVVTLTDTGAIDCYLQICKTNIGSAS